MSRDLEEIKETTANWQVSDKFIITTEKDAARLHLHADKLREWGTQIAVLPITVSLLFNEGYDFDSLVLNYVETTITENQVYYE
jgi:tetraacyldisaccharide 4'-kinase